MGVYSSVGCGGGDDGGSSSTTLSTGPSTGPTGETTASTSGGTSMTTDGESGTTESVKFDVAGELDVADCPRGDCDEICETEFTDFVDPVQKCAWMDEGIVMTPVVADLEDDGSVEIIFVIWGSGTEAGKLVIIDGSDCTELLRTPVPIFGERSQLAVADLDGDGDLEIAGQRKAANTDYGTHEVVVTDHLGNVLATSGAAQVTASWADGGPAIANLDGQGPPEILYGGMALRYQNGNFMTLYDTPITSGYWGILTGVADVDLDGVREVVTGNRILHGLTGADETPPGVAAFPAGYVAIADFDDSTPEPEIALVSSQQGQPGTLRVYHPVTGNLVIGPVTFGQQWGGPPTVGDFDGDEEPEIAAAGYQGYFVFDRECDPNNLPAFCESPWVRWSSPTVDASSGSTASTLFDFNGDGRAEVVYRDEQMLRIYDGDTGDVLSQFPLQSGTILDMPVVADVDNDDHAELVVPGMFADPGVFVLEDPDDLWVPARAIWNQHTYHVTNVMPDGSIPAVEANNWTIWNNYRQQVGPEDKPCKPAPEG